jgi:hypothetical protein
MHTILYNFFSGRITLLFEDRLDILKSKNTFDLIIKVGDQVEHCYPLAPNETVTIK